jgi:hypothetical protein
MDKIIYADKLYGGFVNFPIDKIVANTEDSYIVDSLFKATFLGLFVNAKIDLGVYDPKNWVQITF